MSPAASIAFPITEHHGLAIASAAVPHGVVCLVSALQFHGIGTQLPSDVWLAIDRRARRPALKYPPLRVVRYSGTALTEGVETHELEGQEVKIYNVAKTLADCFKYRNKIGIDVALEALGEAWLAGKASRRSTCDSRGYCRNSRSAKAMGVTHGSSAHSPRPTYCCSMTGHSRR